MRQNQIRGVYSIPFLEGSHLSHRSVFILVGICQPAKVRSWAWLTISQIGATKSLLDHGPQSLHTVRWKTTITDICNPMFASQFHGFTSEFYSTKTWTFWLSGVLENSADTVHSMVRDKFKYKSGKFLQSGISFQYHVFK